MKEIKFKKIKLSKKYLVKNDPHCKNSYALSLYKYISITLKDMQLSEVSKKRKTEARYGSRALIAKKNKKKIGKLISYYKGELKNGKADGWGVEVLISPPVRIYKDHTVVQYYEGEWKKGKRNGYGECYDHHPLLGPAHQIYAEGQREKIYICQDDDNDIYYRGSSYKGNWKDGIMKK
tara:strand:+ start:877 stop:1410 length:534 start_codon:yes stop_codon:yes gene_type:complete